MTDGYGGPTLAWNVALTAGPRGGPRDRRRGRRPRLPGLRRSRPTRRSRSPCARRTRAGVVTVAWDAAVERGVPVTGYRVQVPGLLDTTVGADVRSASVPTDAAGLSVRVTPLSRAGSPRVTATFVGWTAAGGDGRRHRPAATRDRRRRRRRRRRAAAAGGDGRPRRRRRDAAPRHAAPAAPTSTRRPPARSRLHPRGPHHRPAPPQAGQPPRRRRPRPRRRQGPLPVAPRRPHDPRRDPPHLHGAPRRPRPPSGCRVTAIGTSIRSSAPRAAASATRPNAAARTAHAVPPAGCARYRRWRRRLRACAGSSRSSRCWPPGGFAHARAGRGARCARAAARCAATLGARSIRSGPTGGGSRSRSGSIGRRSGREAADRRGGRRPGLSLDRHARPSTARSSGRCCASVTCCSSTIAGRAGRR